MTMTLTINLTLTMTYFKSSIDKDLDTDIDGFHIFRYIVEIVKKTPDNCHCFFSDHGLDLDLDLQHGI